MPKHFSPTTTLWLDLETTGVDSEEHQIFQLSGLVEIEGEIAEKVDLFFDPTNFNWSEYAKEMHQPILDNPPKPYISEKEGYARLHGLFAKYVETYDKKQKMVLAGYNTQFDYRFLEAMWLRCNDKFLFSYLHPMPIDVATLVMLQINAGTLAVDLQNLKSTKLVDVCAYYDIPLLDAHTGMGDIEATRALYYRILEDLLQ